MVTQLRWKRGKNYQELAPRPDEFGGGLYPAANLEGLSAKETRYITENFGHLYEAADADRELRGVRDMRAETPEIASVDQPATPAPERARTPREETPPPTKEKGK